MAGCSSQFLKDRESSSSGLKTGNYPEVGVVLRGVSILCQLLRMKKQAFLPNVVLSMNFKVESKSN